MKKSLLPVAAIAAVLTGTAHAAPLIQLNFTDAASLSVGTIGSAGTWYTLDAGSATTTDVANLVDSTNASTGVSIALTNVSGFQNATRAEGGTGANATASDTLSTWTAASVTRDPNSGVTYTADSKFFPWAVVGTYSADNTSGRDGLMAFKFSSATQLTYKFWVMSSFDNNNPINAPGLFNIGGTYASNVFTGGTTLALNGSKAQSASDSILDSGETSPGSVKYEVGRLGTSFQSIYNGTSGLYELTFQAGMAAGANPSGAAGVYRGRLQWDERPSIMAVQSSSARLPFKRREFTTILPFIAFAILAILGLTCIVAPFVDSQQ